jgi:hypothetical protein
MENLTRFHSFLLSSFFNYSPLFVAQGVSLLEKREILKRTCGLLMLALLLMYQRQVHLNAQHHWLKVTVLVTPHLQVRTHEG